MKISPENPTFDEKRNSERNVYNAFANYLPPDWYGIYSYKINTQEENSEIDFIVFVPSKGIFIIEVKGGRIRIEDRNWYSTDRNGIRHPLNPPPLRQAENYKHYMIKWLNKKGYNIPVGYGVIFPDCDFCRYNGNNLEAPNDIIIDQSKMLSLRDLRDSFNQLIEYNLSQIKNTTHNVNLNFDDNILESIKRIMVQNVKPTEIRAMMDNAETTIIRLTEEQYETFVDTVKDNRRILIKGPAGTGKTVIGIKLAKYYADENKKVLLTCYNELLGLYLKRQFDNANITAGNIYSIMKSIILNSNLSDETKMRIEINNNMPQNEIKKIYDEIYFDVFAQAITTKPVKYDVIIVDELQDLSYKKFWNVFEQLSHNDTKFIFIGDFEFQDINPNYNNLGRINEQDWRDRFNFFNIPLKINCRNPERVARLVGETLNIEYSQPRQTIPGEVIIVTVRNREHLIFEVNRRVERLLKNGIEARNITILTLKNKNDTLLSENLTEDKKYYKYNDNTKIQFETVRRFKGLENKVIMIVDADNDVREDERRKLFYQGFTRAKSIVYLFKHTGLQLPNIRDIAKYE